MAIARHLVTVTYGRRAARRSDAKQVYDQRKLSAAIEWLPDWGADGDFAAEAADLRWTPLPYGTLDTGKCRCEAPCSPENTTYRTLRYPTFSNIDYTYTKPF